MNYVDLNLNTNNLNLSTEVRLKQVADVLMYGILPELSKTEGGFPHKVKHPIPTKFHKFNEGTWLCLIEDIVEKMRYQLDLKPDYEYYDEYPWSRSDALWIVNTVNNCILPFITISKTNEYLIDCITND